MHARTTQASRTRFIRNHLSVALAAALTGAGSLPAAALAQEAEAQEATRLDRIEVTGTRIKKAELEDTVPVQTITREDIERSGLTSIADVIQEISGSGSALNTRFNSSGNFGFPPDGSGVGAGSSTVDLRHLGSKRVLVLVDGIRWVNEASASGVSSSTDLNTIPLAIVERIEVLEDGASSIYGSDAIAGVVNIITRRNFDGAQVTLNYGQYGEGDGETKGVDFAWGGSSDRASWFLGASYTDQDEVSAADREQSRFPLPGLPGDVAIANGGSSNTPTGRFRFTDPNTGASYDITPNTGVSAPVFDPSQTGCERTDDFHCFTGADRFNFSPFNYVVTPSERIGVFGQFRFDITEGVSWYARALYNRRESTNQAAPEPVAFGPSSGAGNPFADFLLVSADNPFNPFGFDLRSVDDPATPDVNEANLTAVNYRPVGGGPRVFEQEVDTMYVGTGFEGTFDVGERAWFWDVNAAYSRNKAEQTNFGSYNIRNINLALGDPAVCAATPGCTPLNFFGGPAGITPEMFAWIRPVVHDESENKLTLFSANLSGDLFDMPAGPLAFAAGYEYRKYEGSYRPDPITVRGEYNGVPSLPTEGEYDVNELFVEVNVPLLADSSWAKNLDLSLAGRYSDYSTFGGEFTPKYGLRWQVVDEFLIRATFAKGFRAPSIGELFGSASRFDATLVDPCSLGLQGQPPPGDPANCAALGVPPGFQQANPQISVITGGNELLDPETSDSFSAGFVWSPSFLENSAVADNVDFEFTFYKHEVEGAIQAIDAQTQLNLCVATLDPVFCNGISRAENGEIIGFQNRLTNLGVIKTDGYDFDVFWTFPESDIGRFRLNWQNTWVGKYEAIGADGSLQPRQVGIEVNDSAIPEWTSNATLDWRLGSWSASWSARHISDLTEDCAGAAGLSACRDIPNNTNKLGSTTYHDIQVGYNFDVLNGLQLTAGVNNVFDKEPPICLSCSLNGYDASTYDIPGGQFWYVRADLKF